AAAFHGLIRTAHAVESGHRGELASALAQWASRWQPTPAVPGPALAFDDWSARLASRRGEFNAVGRLIQARMVAAAGSAAFRDLAGRLAPQADTLDRLNDLAVAEYARGGNFTVLHLCTAGRAARVLMPWVDDAAAAGRELIGAWTAALLSTPPIVEPAAVAAPAPLPWPELRRRAIAQDDEHVIKLVHACGELGAAAGSAPHLAAATRAIVA
ncbi:MAG: DUF4243 domain-containing protein, partial [Burkholderiales bacterium]|nr:DUF4243 domain-containing protein [Burkholderiales bacterium]